MNNPVFSYRYPHPAVTADCVIFGFDGSALKILLIERGIEPFKGLWALPGGFMRIDETVDETARRELHEETGLTNIYMEQFRVFSDVNRDPRERVITVAFIALVKPSDYELVAGDDASNALWFDENLLPPLAFDHHEIIVQAREFLCEMLRLKPAAFELLNTVFSLSELQKVYEVINRTHYDRRNFQRKALQSGLLEEVDNPLETLSPSFGIDEDNVQLRACADTEIDGECPQDYRSHARSSLPKGRPVTRHYSIKKLFNKIKNEDNDTDTESSTRDLFDF
ncbi:MAG: NUDIX hydrolase [Muribaculaceae bacterium]|nr:NUDIX hydrolase [Muribaculaceae bacterium]